MRTRSPVLLLLAVLVVAGCGGEGPSDEEFTADVQQACDEAAADLAIVQGGLVQVADDPAAFTDYYEANVAPVVGALLGELESIEAPEEKAEDYETLLSNFRETSELINEDPGALLNTQEGSGQLAQRVEELNTESDALATDLGLPSDCGEGSGAGGAEASG